jgi:hypothetical protein
MFPFKRIRRPTGIRPVERSRNLKKFKSSFNWSVTSYVLYKMKNLDFNFLCCYKSILSDWQQIQFIKNVCGFVLLFHDCTSLHLIINTIELNHSKNKFPRYQPVVVVVDVVRIPPEPGDVVVEVDSRNSELVQNGRTVRTQNRNLKSRNKNVICINRIDSDSFKMD